MPFSQPPHHPYLPFISLSLFFFFFFNFQFLYRCSSCTAAFAASPSTGFVWRKRTGRWRDALWRTGAAVAVSSATSVVCRPVCCSVTVVRYVMMMIMIEGCIVENWCCCCCQFSRACGLQTGQLQCDRCQVCDDGGKT